MCRVSSVVIFIEPRRRRRRRRYFGFDSIAERVTRMFLLYRPDASFLLSFLLLLRSATVTILHIAILSFRIHVWSRGSPLQRPAQEVVMLFLIKQCSPSTPTAAEPKYGSTGS